MPKIKFECATCGNQGEKYKSQLKNKNYCSSQCGNKAKSLKGPLNGNYGKNWSYDQKLKQSILIKSKVDDDYRSAAGSANKGKHFSQERIAAMHSHRSPDSYRHYPSEEVRIKIGIKSAEKFNEQYNINFRNIMETSGHWIPLENVSDYNLYKKEAHWISHMWDLIVDNNQVTLLNTHKVFHPINNKTGCVRDHMYSKLDGFNAGVPPEILRHPANCMIITHSQNASKCHHSLISIDKLFELIHSYSGNWNEHTIALNEINNYNNGFRWSKSYYINKMKGGCHG